jgi:hypothetical protein
MHLKPTLSEGVDAPIALVWSIMIKMHEWCFPTKKLHSLDCVQQNRLKLTKTLSKNNIGNSKIHKAGEGRQHSKGADGYL